MSLDDEEDFSDRVAGALLKQRQSRSSPRAKAREFVVNLLGKCPDAKLPELIRLPEMREWMGHHKITESQLREALTLARRDVRNSADEIVAKRPQRRRRMPVAVRPEKTAAPTDMFGGLIVENGPISDL
ncbi:hypothetical protein [Sphingobium sp. MP9-4]|uniref:hypothetical protein n=1 Tax=Sphingobium sp. MP9-4 TaxID=1761936 RepID=UPI0010CA8C01|nr:hypothetical protein [Sphingobium sp. MP9-4]